MDTMAILETIKKGADPEVNIIKARKLIQAGKDDTYDLYQYGPYLTMHKCNEFFTEHYNEIKHPILLYMKDIGDMLNAANAYKTKTCKDMKSVIKSVITRASSRMDEYADYVVKHGNDILTNITTIQRLDKVLESAMLNYAPIVPYCGKIVKSEMQDLHDIQLEDVTDSFKSSEILNNTIEICLKDHIVEIMNNFDVVIVSHGYLIDHVRKYNSITDEKKKEEMKWVLNYRIAVYVKYKEVSDFTKVIKTINDCNRIHNGEKIDVSEAVENFGE